MGLESVISSRWVEEIWFRDNTLSAKGLVSSESSSSDSDGKKNAIESLQNTGKLFKY